MWREVAGNDFQFHIFPFDKTFIRKSLELKIFHGYLGEQTKVEQNFSKMTITEDSGLKRTLLLSFPP